MNGNYETPSLMTVADLITELQALNDPTAKVRLESPTGWRDPIVVVVAGHQYGYPEGGLVTL